MALNDISVEFAGFSAADRLNEISKVSPASVSLELLNLFVMVVMDPPTAPAAGKVTLLALNHYPYTSSTIVISIAGSSFLRGRPRTSKIICLH